MAATNLSPMGRVSFPSLYKPTGMEGEPEEKKKYQVNLVFRPSEMDDQQKALFKAMVDAAQEISQEEFGCALGEVPKKKGLAVKSPFLRGESKPQWYLEGDIVVRFISKRQPNVVDQAREPIEEKSGKMYSGCWAHLTWSVFTYDTKTNRGVGFGLRNIQKVRDDEAFGEGATTAEDDFDVLAEQISSGESDGLSDDDIPF